MEINKSTINELYKSLVIETGDKVREFNLTQYNVLLYCVKLNKGHCKLTFCKSIPIRTLCIKIKNIVM